MSYTVDIKNIINTIFSIFIQGKAQNKRLKFVLSKHKVGCYNGSVVLSYLERGIV